MHGPVSLADDWGRAGSTRVFVIDQSSPPPNGYFSFDDPLRGFDVGIWYTGGSLGAFDKSPMQITVALAGLLPTVVDLEILAQSILPFRPSGVSIDWEITTSSGSPVFGLDIENEYIAGCDIGAWGADPDFVANIVGSGG